MAENIVEMKGIEISFHDNRVLKSVDFTLSKGSIHALLGENGTGKTTLMNILGSVLPRDAGKILIDGTEIDKSHKGLIAFIHQELSLVNDLNVYENMFMGWEIRKGILLDKESMKRKAQEILKTMGIELDVTVPVGELNASYKQIVEIARALMKNARVIIMDEPTTTLTDIEIEHIFELMKGLKKHGVSFVFISHKLNEVVKICDSYTVMRDGIVVANGSLTEEITEKLLAGYMVGKELLYDDLYQPRKAGEVILELKHLSRDREFDDINMTIRKGEIVGVTGLLGDGRSELFQTVYGCNQSYQGEIYINGQAVKLHSTQKAQEVGISYVPRDRKENGIIRDMSVADNMSIHIIKNLKKGCFIDKKKVNESNSYYKQELNMKVNHMNDLITALSGGNQQKAVLGKALGAKPSIVILDNPTQGVDIGAKLEIYGIIMRLAAEGVSFVVLSSEAQEILMLCDRAYVMFHGRVKGEFSRNDLSQENIMVVATGGKL